jgi:hypothetical protein
VLPLAGDRKPKIVVQAAMDQPGGEFSPDSRWLAYESSESGRFEVYVQPFPEADGKTLEFGVPVPLFRTRLASGAGQLPGRAHYAVAPDGRFLMNTVIEDTAALPITVVVNWAAALDGR